MSFEKLLPTPKELQNESAPLHKRENETEEEFNVRMKRLVEKYGYADWYEWRVNNWGTKWDPNSVACTSMVKYKKYYSIEYHFLSAWSPPERWLKVIAGMFQKLDFCLNYFEGGMYFKGNLVIKKGIVEIDSCVEGSLFALPKREDDEDAYSDAIDEKSNEFLETPIF